MVETISLEIDKCKSKNAALVSEALALLRLKQASSATERSYNLEKVSECDQETLQSHAADQPTAPRGRAKKIYSNNTSVRQ